MALDEPLARASRHEPPVPANAPTGISCCASLRSISKDERTEVHFFNRNYFNGLSPIQSNNLKLQILSDPADRVFAPAARSVRAIDSSASPPVPAINNRDIRLFF